MSMTLFEALHEDHALQRGLIRELATPRSDSPRRALLWAQLRDELTAHARAEERYLYLPLTGHHRSGAIARDGICGYHELDELLAALDDTDRASGVWLQRANHLFACVQRHLSAEEQPLFPLAATVLGDRERFRFAEDYPEAMREERHAA